jgi:hypothetical protein
LRHRRYGQTCRNSGYTKCPHVQCFPLCVILKIENPRGLDNLSLKIRVWIGICKSSREEIAYPVNIQMQITLKPSTLDFKFITFRELET